MVKKSFDSAKPKRRPGLRPRKAQREHPARRALTPRRIPRLYRALLKASADAVMLLDGNRIILDATESVRLVGLSREQLIGHNLADFFPPSVTRLWEALDIVELTRRPHLHEESIDHLIPGVYVSTQVSPMLDRTGQLAGFVVVSRNIGERRRMEDALRESEERYRALFEGSGEALFLEDDDGRILEVNVRACDLLGYTREELMGLNARDLAPPDASPFLKNSMILDGETQTIVRVETVNQHKNGHLIPVEVNIQRMAVAGRPVWLVSERDISRRKRAEAAEREQRKLAEALRDTAAALISTLDLDEVLDRILSNAGNEVPHDSANIMLLDRDTSMVRVVRCAGYAARGLEAWITALRFPLSTLPDLVHMASTGQPLVISDTQDFPAWVDLPEMRWVRSYAGVPIRSKGQTIGFLNFDSAEPGFFSSEHIVRLNAFADQAAIAIEHAQLFAEAQQRAERMAVLNEIGQALASTMTLDQLYRLIYQQVGRVLDVDAFYVALYDESRGEIHYPCSYDEGEYLPAETLPLGQGPTSHVIRTRSPFTINRPGHPVQHGGTPFGRVDQRSTRLSASAMHVPMFIGDRVIGVISAQSYTENAYRSGDLQMLQLIASQAAVSIQNARLFEAEREQRVLAESLRDTVSILNSTLHFDEVLDHIMDNVGRVVAYDSVSIMLIEGETGIARVVRRRGYAEHRLEAIVLALRFPVSETPSLRFMSETGKPLAISDTQTYPGWVDRVETRWIRSYAGTSIRLKEQVIGFLNVNSAQPGFFTDAHAERLLAFANQAAPAIENARLFEEVSAGRRKLQALSQRLVEVQETERRNIARELHDEIGQTLTGLKLLLDTAHKLPGDRMTARLGEAQAIVNDLIRLARNLSLELRPTMLDDLGLLPALLWLFERYAAQTGVSVNFDHSGVDRRFPSSVETATYRIVQEALTNVARHAQVDHVLVEVRAGDEQLVVKVEDRGVGFDQHAVLGASESGGLIGMRERAFLLGGKLIVESAPGVGTRLIARLPMGDSIEGDESRL